MASFINTNMVSLNTQNNLSKSQDALAQSIKRLSTGLRVNSSKDDAAGLAIANRMDSTIRGQTVAIRNTNDAVSFSQTADGALAQINNTLQRLRELAVQSANGTNSAGDRQLLNTEFNQLQQEVTRIQRNTQFNGTDTLQTSSVTVQIGSGTTQYDKISIKGIDLSLVTSATKTDAVPTNAFTRDQFDAAVTALAKTNAARAANMSFNESNGHIYEKISAPKSFASAAADAAQASFGGSTGYLVTITNAEENKFVSTKTNNVQTWVNATKSDALGVNGTAGKGVGEFASSNAVTDNAAANNSNVFSYTNVGVGAGTSATAGTNPDFGKVTYTNFNSTTLTGGTAEAGATIDGNGTWSDVAISGTASVNAQSFIEYGGNAALAVTGADSSITTLGTGTDSLGAFQVNDGASISATDASTNGYVDSNGAAITTELKSGMTFYIKPQNGTIDFTNTASYQLVDANKSVAHAITATTQQAAASDLQMYGNASGVNILTQGDALSAITALDKAMNQVNIGQIQQGATQNRLSAIISSLTASNESTTNARSHIMDTDFAAETASMARANILQQAGMAMLAQANTSNNGIMALMR
ncbi:MAG: flagellin [Methylococcaceae bacterium]